MKEIQVQYIDDTIKRLENIDGKKSDWIDLPCGETIFIRKHRLCYIKLAVAMKLPEGYEGIVTIRSSTAKRFHIIHTGMGVIDEMYQGPDDWWHLPVFAIKNTIIHKGDRICQFRIIEHQPQIQFKTVERLIGENRGGLGSTGRN